MRPGGKERGYARAAVELFDPSSRCALDDADVVRLFSVRELQRLRMRTHTPRNHTPRMSTHTPRTSTHTPRALLRR
jgi:hypothetical protein